ncbi:MAG TPA: hypothetical protein VK539_22570 [Myxococcaceae bacterium]|nr:hypothetical protein [Myxococcaceae bacterium]
MMTRLFNTMVWLLPLGLWGCSSSSDTPCNTAPDPTPATPMALLVVGEPVRMSLSPFDSGGCAPVGVLPERLTAELTDPDGQVVPSEASMNLPISLNGTLRFTPQKPGLHHFIAAFEPVGGLQQFDLHVARDGSAQAPLTKYTGSCQTLERTDRGSLVCGSQVIRADGFLLANLPAGRTAVAGNVVWLAGSTRIERYVDTGTGTKLELSATLSHVEGAAGFIMATPDELLVLYPQALRRFTFDGAALVSTGRTTWEGAATSIDVSSLRIPGLLLRSGDRLALISRAPASEGQGHQACAYQLEAAGPVRTSEPCQLLSDRLLGYERSVLWTGTPLAGRPGIETLHRMEWTGSRLEPRGSLFVGPSLGVGVSGLQGPTAVPILRGTLYELRGLPSRAGVPVYLRGEDRLVIESLDVDIADPQASSTLLWGTSRSGSGSRIRQRPSTP